MNLVDAFQLSNNRIIYSSFPNIHVVGQLFCTHYTPPLLSILTETKPDQYEWQHFNIGRTNN